MSSSGRRRSSSGACSLVCCNLIAPIMPLLAPRCFAAPALRCLERRCNTRPFSRLDPPAAASFCLCLPSRPEVSARGRQLFAEAFPRRRFRCPRRRRRRRFIRRLCVASADYATHERERKLSASVYDRSFCRQRRFSFFEARRRVAANSQICGAARHARANRSPTLSLQPLS